MNREEKIDKTLESLSGMQRAAARHNLYDGVLHNAGKAVVKYMHVKRVTFLKAAACVALLAGINIFTVVHYTKSQKTATASNAFVTEYFGY